MNVKHFKHVGKVYCLNIGDSFYTKCGNVLKVKNKTLAKYKFHRGYISKKY